MHFLIIHLGTKAEMEKLEDQFVAGSWAPPFMTPPKKKRKVKQRQQQPKEKTQKENKPKKTKEKSKQTYCNSNNNDKLLCFLDKVLMVTNPPVFPPIVSSPHQFITPLTTSNHDATPTSNHPFSSGTLTTSTSYQNITSNYEDSLANTLTKLNSVPVLSSYSLTPATVGLVSAVPSSHLTTSTSHQDITFHYENSVANTLNVSNSVTNPVLSSCSLTSATVDLVSAMPSSLLTTSTNHQNITSNYEHSLANTLTMSNSTTNPVPCSYSLTPATIGLVSATAGFASATINVPSSLLTTSPNHPTIFSNNALNAIASNPVTCPTITSSHGTSPFTMSTVDLMSSLVATSSHHTTISNNELDAEGVLDALSGMDDLYGWDSSLTYNDNVYTEGT